MENKIIGTTIGDNIPDETAKALAGLKGQIQQEEFQKEIREQDTNEDDITTPSEDLTNIELGKDEYTLNELFKIKTEKIPFLLEGLIPKNNLTVLAGPSDVGKSTLYTQLVTRIVTGETTFLWKKLNPANRNVLIVSTEDDEVVFSIRVKRQLSGEVPTNEQGKRLRFWPDGHDVIRRLESFLSIRKVDLIVIDALSDVFKADLNSGNATRNFLGSLSRMAKKHRMSVLVVHHARKTDTDNSPHKDKLLGSVGIEGIARSVLFMSRIKNDPLKRGLHIVKGNYVDDQVKSRSDVLLFDKDTLTFSKIDDTDRKWITNMKETKPGVKRDREKVMLAWKLRNDGKTMDEIAKICDVNKSTVSRWLKPARVVFTVDESFVVP